MTESLMDVRVNPNRILVLREEICGHLGDVHLAFSLRPAQVILMNHDILV